MSSLSFPDLNVWVAIAAPRHMHHKAAAEWWAQETSDICFFRHTQIGFLRLCTTAAAMDGRPLTMVEAWAIYDWFFQDDRVKFVAERAGTEADFRRSTGLDAVSPKLWADLWMLAFAKAAGGRVVTFDRALAGRGALCLP